MTDHLHALPAGHELGEYRIKRVLSVGGFGITCYTRGIHLDKLIAVKKSLPNEFALRTDATTVKPKSTSDEAITNGDWSVSRTRRALWERISTSLTHLPSGSTVPMRTPTD